MMAKLEFGESQNIEYKQSWRDEYLKWICGFANAQGGRLYIGVNDNREVVGVADAKKLSEDIPNKIVSQLGIVCGINILKDGDREYVEIIVEPSDLPISYHGKYHYRSGSTKQELNGVALQQFIMKKMKVTWESTTPDFASLDDISEDAVRFFQRHAVWCGRLPASCREESVEHTLRRLHVMTPDGKLTLAALLLFGKDIEQWCPSAIFRIGRFRRNDADLIGSDDVSCPLIMMPETLMQVLRNKYLTAPIHYEGMQRIEPLEIPDGALREMLCNAIVHKDYQKTFIQMKIWDDRITLWNPGTLPEGFTAATLMESHESSPRNDLMARVFYLAGYIENWGRGYEKIVEGFRKEKLSVPRFEIVRGGLLATIQREKFISLIQPVFKDGTQDVTQDITQSVTQGVTQGGLQGGLQDLDLDSWIEFMVKYDPRITLKEMASLSKKNIKTIKRHIAKLPHIVFIGSGYSGHWEVKP